MNKNIKYVISVLAMVLLIATVLYPTIKADETHIGTLSKEIELNLGYIRVTTANEENCDVPIVDVVAYNYNDLEINTPYLLYVDYYICCPGSTDHAWIDMALDDNYPMQFDYGDGPPAIEGRLEYPLWINPSSTPDQQTFKVKLHAIYKDWAGWPNEVILGEETGYSTLKGILPMPELSITDDMGRVVDSVTVSGKKGETGSVYFRVANTGDGYTELKWQITNINLIDQVDLLKIEWSIDPTSGNLNYNNAWDTIDIHTNALKAKDQTVNAGTITFSATGSNGYYATKTINVNLNIRIKSKEKSSSIIHEWIKMLWRSFDRLFEWLRTIIPINYPS